MSDLNACRACLALDGTLCNISKSPLRLAFETATGLLLQDNHRFPQYLCEHCCFTVQRFYTFRKQCHMVQDTLQRLDSKGMLTTESIELEKRGQHFTVIGAESLHHIQKEQQLSQEDEQNDTAVVCAVQRPLVNDCAPQRDNWIAEEEDYMLRIDVVKEEIGDTVSTMNNEMDHGPSCPDSETVNEAGEPRTSSRLNKLQTNQVSCTSNKEDYMLRIDVVKEEMGDTVSTMNNEMDYGPSCPDSETAKEAGEPKTKRICRKSSRLNKLQTNQDSCTSGKCEKECNLNGHLSKHGSSESVLHRANKEICRKNSEIQAKENAYICDTCGKAFRTRNNICNHIKTHTGLKPNKCIQKEQQLRQDNKQNDTAVVCSVQRPLVNDCAPQRDINWIAEEEDYMLRIDVVKEETDDTDSPMDYEMDHAPSGPDSETVNEAGEPKTKRICRKPSRLNKLQTNRDSCTTGKSEECNLSRDLSKHGSSESVLHRANKEICRKNSELYKTQAKEYAYICDTCGKAFRTRNNICNHIKTHMGLKPYKCSICKKSFPTSSHLHIHRRRHTGEKAYPCQTCGKQFSGKSDWQKHGRTHTGEKPFKCDTCDKAFSVSSHLTIHQRKHTGEKPYKCETCPKTFIDSSSLARHKKIHTGEKPHKCHECGKSFLVNKDLTNHLRVHTGEKPYKCDKCDKSFVNSSALCRHKRLHIEAKPFKCDACDKSFSTKEYCVQHKASHDQSFACGKCGKTLSNKRALGVHEKIHAR